jgi:hypothetical protein
MTTTKRPRTATTMATTRAMLLGLALTGLVATLPSTLALAQTEAIAPAPFVYAPPPPFYAPPPADPGARNEENTEDTEGTEDTRNGFSIGPNLSAFLSSLCPLCSLCQKTRKLLGFQPVRRCTADHRGQGDSRSRQALGVEVDEGLPSQHDHDGAGRRRSRRPR